MGKIMARRRPRLQETGQKTLAGGGACDPNGRKLAQVKGLGLTLCRGNTWQPYRVLENLPGVPLARPVGTVDNSPAIDRWVWFRKGSVSPVGTSEFSKFRTSFQNWAAVSFTCSHRLSGGPLSEVAP